jgi:hypothetical protein
MTIFDGFKIGVGFFLAQLVIATSAIVLFSLGCLIASFFVG